MSSSDCDRRQLFSTYFIFKITGDFKDSENQPIEVSSLAEVIDYKRLYKESRLEIEKLRKLYDEKLEAAKEEVEAVKKECKEDMAIFRREQEGNLADFTMACDRKLACATRECEEKLADAKQEGIEN